MDQTRWLSEDEQTAWRGLMAATDLIDRRLDEQLQRDSGMPHAYYMVLVALSEQPGRACRMSVLAERTMSSQSRLSHAVARLEERGWVRRDPSTSDGRGKLAVLTDAGRRALREAAPGHVEQVRRVVFDRLTQEQVKQLAEITAAITAPLDDTAAARSDSSCAPALTRRAKGSKVP
jgi:DNA-binding MarR family transcriptional regulator